MNITRDMRAVMRQYELTEPMARAVYSGEGDAVIDCNWRTEAALIERRLMHRTMSNLTPEGRDVLAALKAAEGVIELAAPAAVETPTAPEEVVEAEIVTKGSEPKHSDHPDVRAAITALDNLKLAELTDGFEPGEGASVRGFMVEPRGHGRVAVYWVFGGGLRDYDDKPFRVELQIAADRLSKAGWRVEPKPKSALCVFAWRPITEAAHEAAVQMEAEAVARLPKFKAGDLIEAETVSTMPTTIKFRIDRQPWQNTGHFGTVLCNAEGGVVVKTDSIRIVDETPAPVPPMSAALVANTAAANDVLAGVDFEEDEPPTPAVRPNLAESAAAAEAFFATPRPERLHESVSYGIQWRTAGGDWKGHVTSAALHSTAEADDYIADAQALAEPGIELRAVEIRLTHTALPAPAAAKPSDVDHGPVAARTLRSGCRIDLHGAERLVWKVEYFHAGHYLRVHTVPPVGEHPGYFTFTLSPGDTVELISRGPAVDVAGEPVDTTR